VQVNLIILNKQLFGVTMIKYFLLTIVALAFLAGCSSISVTEDYDPSADFAKYKTFALFTGEIKGSVLESAPLAKKRVMEAVSSDMQKKGFTQVDSSKADLMIYVQGGTTEKMNVTDYGYGYGGWWGAYPYGRNIDVSYYTQASLIIDLVDNSKHELVWRGVGTAVMQDGGTPEERQQRIDEAVAKILSQYPPTKE
jgi:hypothetical protein